MWVVDTKRYPGRVRRGRLAGRLVFRRTLVVNGHDRGDLATAVRRQRALVRSVVGPGVDIRGVLCFADEERGPVARPFSMGGIMVTWPKALVRTLAAPGPLGPGRRVALARQLAREFPSRAVHATGDAGGDSRARGSRRQA